MKHSGKFLKSSMKSQINQRRKMIKVYKEILFPALLFLAILGRAQTPLDEAIDFNVTDVEGNEIHLFELLDDGKYVLIDFFFTTCGPCQDVAPRISEAYEYFGCGEYEIEFIAMDWGDTDEECIEFDYEFGVSYPTVSGIDGGGDQVVADYQIPLFPTVILIAPDHSIVENYIWPIPSSQSLIDDLEFHGINSNYCSLNADFNPFNNDICAGEYILFHDHSVGEIEEWEWTFEGGIPNQSNLQNPVVYYAEAGIYDVTLRISNEDEESTHTKENIVYIHNCSRIKEIDDSMIKIYPNPIIDFLFIESNLKSNSDTYEINIVNLMGQIIFSKTSNLPVKIETNLFSDGIYFIQLKNENITYSKKIKKKK